MLRHILRKFKQNKMTGMLFKLHSLKDSAAHNLIKLQIFVFVREISSYKFYIDETYSSK